MDLTKDTLFDDTFYPVPHYLQLLSSKHKPCYLFLVATEKWNGIDECSINEVPKSCGLVLMVNHEDPGKSSTDLASDKSAFISALPVPRKPITEDSFDLSACRFTSDPGDPVRLPPNSFLVLGPNDLSSLKLRCPNGQARISAWIYPAT